MGDDTTTPIAPAEAAPVPVPGAPVPKDKNATVAHGHVRETGKHAEYLFIPEGQRLAPAKIVDLFTKTWKLQMPNVLLLCDAGSVHPRAFASKKLTELPQFEKIWGEAMKQVTERIEAGEDSDTAALALVNDVLFEKLVTIFSAVLDSATLSNNWIIVDRINSKSAAAELILEAAIARTPASPTVLVIDCLQRFGIFTSDETKMQISHLQKIKAGGQPLGTDSAIDDVEVTRIQAWQTFMDPANFYDKTLPRPPEKAHIGADGSVSDRMKWQYHYLQSAFAAGTHYVLISSFNDSFDVDALGPAGFILANGQGMAYERVKARIQAGSALVMIQNTGGVVQAFASLHRGMLSSVPPPDTITLLGKLELVSPERWSSNFGVTEINILKELNQRAPQLLRKTIVQVDLLNDSSEEVLATLSNCFSGGTSMPELGLGEAEVLTALSAWKRHISLWENAATFSFRATVLQLTLFAFGLLTVTVSVVYSNNKKHTDADLVKQYADLMVILPIVTGVIGTIRSKLRFKEKGAACLMGAHNIVSEIYKYRLRAGQYDTIPKPSTDDDDDAPKLTPKQLEQRAREMCVETCQDVYAKALASEVSKGSALNHPKAAMLNTASSEERTMFFRKLESHVAKELYGETTKSKGWGSKKVSPNAEGGDEAKSKSKGGEIDDFSSPLELDIYIDFRVRSMAKKMEKRTPSLALQLNILEVCALLANAFGGMLAVLGYAQWVSVAVATGIIFASLQDYYALPSQVGASNEATAEIHSVISWWDSLSLVQRKKRDTKQKAAELAEAAILKPIAAQTGMPAGAGGGAGEEEEEEK